MAKKILLVDDEIDLLAVTKARLENAGYKTFTAESAEDALAHLQEDIPDLILLDLLLPHMQGDEFCKNIRTDLALRQIPVILFTASASNIPKIAEEIGADDYIMKPFEPAELLKKIRKLIG